ncbi:MAG: 3-oxoadipate CoA-transferase [Rhodospirillaceae bacterium]|nr:3-oxoadipate CoA-transferase [Rhodospirillaceae bacterium]
MAIDKRMVSPSDAVADVKDGAVVMVSGFGGAGFPNIMLDALREQGLRDLTLVVNSATHVYSLTHTLIEAGQVAKVICTAARGRGEGLSPFEKLWRDGRIELECIPQGNFSERIRAGGAGIPAFYTPVGHGTDLAVGKEVREFGGRLCVLETAITGDLALVRGDRADPFGNVTFLYAQMNFGPAMASACSTTVAEVREALEEPMSHNEVQLPSVYVDRVVAVGGEP